MACLNMFTYMSMSKNVYSKILDEATALLAFVGRNFCQGGYGSIHSRTNSISIKWLQNKKMNLKLIIRAYKINNQIHTQYCLDISFDLSSKLAYKQNAYQL